MNWHKMRIVTFLLVGLAGLMGAWTTLSYADDATPTATAAGTVGSVGAAVRRGGQRTDRAGAGFRN